MESAISLAKYSSKRLFALTMYIICTLVFAENSFSQALEPISDTIVKLTISIDPRTELISVLALLSGTTKRSGVDSSLTYCQLIYDYYKPYLNDSATIKVCDYIRDLRLVRSDLTTNILCQSNLPELNNVKPFPNSLLKNVNFDENKFNNLNKLISEFARKTNFIEFWKSNISYYSKIVKLTSGELKGIDYIEELNKFYNYSQNSYNVIISPAIIGGYGINIEDKSGKKDIFACLSANVKKDNIPYVKKSTLIYYLWHEFSHSYINPLVDQYSEQINNSQNLFIPIKNNFISKNPNYTNWTICVYEHLVRAANICIMENSLGKARANEKLKEEIRNGFVYIEPIVNKMKTYENIRDKERITFKEYFPQLITVFDSLLKSDYLNYVKNIEIDTTYQGGVHDVLQKSKKIAIIYSTNDSDTNSLKIPQLYSERVLYNNMKSVCQATLIPDTVAVNMNFKDCGIIACGTIKSNLFLTKYKSILPFNIIGDTIIADNKFYDKGIQLLACVQNPFDNTKGMVVYTAADNKYLMNFDFIKWYNGDYILFIDKNNILSYGDYNKASNWKFIQE